MRTLSFAPYPAMVGTSMNTFLSGFSRARDGPNLSSGPSERGVRADCSANGGSTPAAAAVAGVAPGADAATSLTVDGLSGGKLLTLMRVTHDLILIGSWSSGASEKSNTT